MLTIAKVALFCALFATAACSLQKDPIFTRQPDAVERFQHATFYIYTKSHIIKHVHDTEKWYYQTADTMYQTSPLSRHDK